MIWKFAQIIEKRIDRPPQLQFKTQGYTIDYGTHKIFCNHQKRQEMLEYLSSAAFIKKYYKELKAA